ncbi:MAG: galactitol-1-phosphate 5-dehydrogenase [Brevinema sp.]
MSKKMTAALVTANNVMEVSQVDVPTPKENEVLVKVAYAGVCGSDYGRLWNNEARYYPIILGHEFSGMIVEAGAAVKNYHVNDRVAVAPLVPCMTCSYCEKGLHQQCPNYSFIGSRQNGAFAEYAIVPEVSLVRLNNEISLRDAAFIEPVTVGLHGLSLLQQSFHDKRVAVLGIGGIGLLTMQSLLNLGASNVTALDIDAARLKEADKIGVHHTINLAETPEKDVFKKFDVVIESAGSVPTTKLSLKLADARGEVLFIGTPHADITFSFDEWELVNRKELTLKGSWMNYSAPYPGKEWTDALDFFKAKKYKVDTLIGREVSLKDLPQALEQFKNREFSGKIFINVDSTI